MRKAMAGLMMFALSGCTTLVYDYAPHGMIMGAGPTDTEKAQTDAIAELIRIGGEFGIVRTSYGILSPGLKHMSVYACQPGEFPNRCKRVDRAVASASPLLMWWGSAALAAWGLRGSGDETNVSGGNAVSGSSSKAISKAEAEARAKTFLKQDVKIKLPKSDGGCKGVFVSC